MGRAKPLSNEKRGKITAFKECGLSNREISRRLNRSSTVIDNFIKIGQNYNFKKSTGRPKVLTDREKRAILRVASNSALSARGILDQCGVKTGIRNVQRLIKRTLTLIRKKLLRKPPLNKLNKNVRLNFSRNKMNWSKKWRQIIFSDEKKFNLDGPDGFSYYYHDLRKDERIILRRQMEGGSVMIWYAIGYKGRSRVVFLDGRINAMKYKDLLNTQKSCFRKIAGRNFIFQQDIAPIHLARIIKLCFETNSIPILDWPVRFPGLNIIENVWGLLTKEVYKDTKQYTSVCELKKSILEAWTLIFHDVIKKLYDTIPNRIFDTIRANGGFTKY
jgi:transposase